MTLVRPNLPDFDRPPVVEVALSIQFETLRGFRAIHLGTLWEKFSRARYPYFEEQPPVPKAIERLGRPLANIAPRFELLNLPPLARYVFISSDRTEAIQVQPDRLTFNWRKTTEEDVYPRYEPIAAKFSSTVAILEDFVREEKLGSLKVEQAEITYVNKIQGESVATRIESVLSVFSGKYSSSHLPEPEGVNIELVFPINHEREQVGRLYINGAAGTNADAGTMDLRLIARGHPSGTDIKAALDFFAIGRASIVRGFTSVTSKEMHKAWGRTDDISD